MTEASVDGDKHTFASLPASLQAAVLQRVTEEASQFCRLSLVCRSWRDLVRSQRWPHLRSLTLYGAGGLSPFVALAPDVDTVCVCPDTGLSSAELSELQSLPLKRLQIEGMAALSPEVLVCLASPLLTELSVRDCALDVARLAALLSQCPALTSLCVTNAPLRRVSACGAFVEELEAAGQRLTSLNLSGSCEWLDTTMLGALASSCTHLELLDVGGARDVTAFPAELLELPSLRILRARQAGLQGDHVAVVVDAMPDDAPLLPSLQQLDVSGCYRLRSRGLQSLAKALDRATGQPLTHLNVSEILDLGDSDAMCLLAAAKQRAQHRPHEHGLALTVASCGRLGKAFAAALCEGGFALDEFHASGLSMLDADALNQLAAVGVLSATRALDLSHCQRLAPPASAGDNTCVAAAIASAVCCAGPSLKTLLLDGCCVTDASLQLIAEACPQLEEVSLVGCAVSSPGFAALGEKCPHVASLSLGGRRCCPDADALAFRALRTLRLHRFRGMAADTLASVARGCRHLQVLSLAACGGVTDDALLLLAREAPQLRVLTLQAEDHTELRGATLQHLSGLRCLTLRQCPNIGDDGVLRLLARNDQLARLALPLKLHLCMSQRIPVRVQPAPPATGLAHWRPPPTLRMELT